MGLVVDQPAIEGFGLEVDLDRNQMWKVARVDVVVLVVLVVPAVSAIDAIGMGMHHQKGLVDLAVSVVARWEACSWVADVGIVDPFALGNLVAAAILGADLVEGHSKVSQEQRVELVGWRPAEDMAQVVGDENWNEVSSAVCRRVDGRDVHV